MAAAGLCLSLVLAAAPAHARQESAGPPGTQSQEQSEARSRQSDPPSQQQPASGSQEQSGEPLVTDRPDATESTETVAPGRLQIESGYTYQRAGDLRVHQAGEILLRIGAIDRLEVRVGLDSWLHQRAGGATDEGWGDSSLGVKWKLADGGGAGSARPALAVLASTTLPTGASAVSDPAMRPEVRLASAWELPGGLGLGANLLYGRPEAAGTGERFGEVGSSVALGIGLTDRLGAFVEHFGTYPLADGFEDENFVNGGVTLLLGPDAQLDARLGYGLNGRDDDVFVGLGSAFRW